ncbi:hypothetical protein Rsub_03367 [Raphidocelis subcapitata]|uniref:Cyclic nucleotide-binding domain-containing protein n=1 Tax=Raphidocelis subcapitata TaxID=307507 RepID=A0A2V0NRG8_9CHLO|nr:hypothetical protein Rsub_03367 [Raphidocelis subcapitata]|eukprot:GBF90234.1 hypothetical protein Rsub_03367 [Raphidocelis subcapitata]
MLAHAGAPLLSTDAQAALAAAPHERPDAALDALASHLSGVPFFAPLAAEARRCVARNTQLTELCGSGGPAAAHGADFDRSVYAIVSGSVWLVQGAREEALLILQHEARQLPDEADPAAAAPADVGAALWRWLQGAAATAASQGGTRRRAGSAGAGRGGGLAAVRLETGATFSGEGVEWSAAGAEALALLQDAAASSGQQACDGGQPGLPPKGLAVVADGGTAACLLRISGPAILEAVRANAEAAAAAAVDACCGVPALRHTPVRELRRLARHLRRVEFAPGEMLLHQGREVGGVFILLAGTVRLQVARQHAQQPQPVTPFAAPKAAADPAGCLAGDGPGGAGAAHQAGLPQEPIVLGTRGPGALLGDDFVRERRMACSAVASTRVVAFRLPPHKLPQVLDPLTLRLLARLRPQLGAAAAAALLEAAAAEERGRAAAEHRAVVLAATYGGGAAGSGAETLPSAAGRLQQERAGGAAGDSGGVPATLMRPAAAAAADADGDPAALAAAAAAQLDPSAPHTDVFESAAVAVIDLCPAPPGQQPLGSASAAAASAGEEDGAAVVLASAVDDAVAKFVAVAHDAGLRLVRLAATRYVLICELPVLGGGGDGAPGEDDEPEGEEEGGDGGGGAGGGGRRAAARSVANSLLAMGPRLAGVVARAACPYLRLCAGAAVGACFLESCSGDFVRAVSGRAWDAAARMAALAAARPGCGDAVVVTDGLRQLLARSHDLAAVGGGFLLLRETARSGGGGGGGGSTGRAPSTAPGTVPPPPPHAQQRRGGAAQARRLAAAARRQMIRKKYEALEVLLAAGEGLQRAPEYLLTQPPPAQGAAGAAAASGEAEAARSGGPGAGQARLRPRLTVRIEGGGQGEEAGESPAQTPAPAGGSEASLPASPMRAPARARAAGGVGAAGLLAAAERGGGAAGGAQQRGAAGTTGTAIQTRLQVWEEVERMRVAAGAGGGWPAAPAATATTPKSTRAGRSAIAAPWEAGAASGSGAGAAEDGAPGPRQLAAWDAPAADASGAAAAPRETKAVTFAAAEQGQGGVPFASEPRPKTVAVAWPAGALHRRVGGGAAKAAAATAAQLPGSGQPPRTSGGSGSGTPSPRRWGAGGALRRCLAINPLRRPNQRGFVPWGSGSGSSGGGSRPASGGSAGFGPPPPPRGWGALEREGDSDGRDRGSGSGGAAGSSALGSEAVHVDAARAAIGSAAGAARLAAALPLETADVNLSACGLYRLPDLDHLPRLESLAASCNHLSGPAPAPASARRPPAAPLPAGIGRLPPRLVSLCLAFNEIEALPGYLVAALPLLEELDVSFNKLTDLPPNIGDWGALRRLAASGNRLGRLPDGVAALASLRAVVVDGNELTELPPSLGASAPRLEVLSARGNRLVAAPAGLAACGCMLELDLSSNHLVPGGLDPRLLGALSSLTALRLADNPALFDEREGGSGGGGGGGLGGGGADCSSTGSRQWFEAWLGTQQLQQLQLGAASGRSPADAPARPLPSLRALELSRTGLSRLPAWLPAGLLELSASDCRLQALPAWACARLSGGLYFLDLRSNPIAALPREVSHLVALRALALEGCPCASPEACAPLRGSEDPPEGSAAWAAGWLAGRKLGRPWPPGPRARRLPAALLAAAGVPPQAREDAERATRTPAAATTPAPAPAAAPAHEQQRHEQPPAGAAPGRDASAPSPSPPPAAVTTGRRRAAIFVAPIAV